MNYKDITPINSYGAYHGYVERYYNNSILAQKGNYIHGKADGHFEVYYSNGMLGNIGTYINGKKIGYWENHSRDGVFIHKIYYIL